MAGGHRSARDPDDRSTIELLERELARAYRIERALRDVGLALGTTLDLDALLRLILERTTEALEAERATLYLVEHKQFEDSAGMSVSRDQSGALTRWETMLVSRVVEGGSIDEISLHLGQGIAGEVARTGKTANVRDAYSDPRFQKSWDERTGFRTRSVLCVPLRSQLGRIIGVIQVLNKRPGGPVSDTGTWNANDDDAYFDDDDEALLAALAAQAAVSIEQARLFGSILEKNRELQTARGQLEKKVQDLNVLFAIERATARATNRDELALAILPEAARVVGGRTAYVVLGDESGDLSLLHIGTDAVDAMPPDSLAPPSLDRSRGVNSSSGERPSVPGSQPPTSQRGSVSRISLNPNSPLRRLRIKAGEGLVGKAIASGQTIVVADAGVEQKSSARIHAALFPHGEHLGAPCVIVPLLDEHDHAFGALATLRRSGDRPFADDDVDLLRLVALNASTGFQLQAAREAHGREARLTTIGSLLSGMLHDLKTPMAVISGYVQLMTSEGDGGTRSEYAELVLKQFEHIAAMQKEVLDFARGERSILVRKVYLARFFDDFESQLRRELDRRKAMSKANIELSIDVRDRGTARFDESKLTRALANLTRNAVEAIGDRGGKLTITSERDSTGALVITVADTGPGILAEVQERLFESFVTAGKKTGTGLGLAIVKKIAEDHGGTIEATSTSQGARFTLRLPQPQEAPGLRRTPTVPPVR